MVRNISDINNVVYVDVSARTYIFITSKHVSGHRSLFITWGGGGEGRRILGEIT